MTGGGKKIWSSQRIYLNQRGGVALKRGCFYQPMYKDLSEVLELVKISFERAGKTKLDYKRPFKRGVIEESEWVPASYVGFEVEEYFIYEKGSEGRNLLFRIQPFFLSHNKRIECRIYEAGQAIGGLISYYLGICAKMNNAKLIMNDCIN
jgi:hypothetical protein|tara:strand:- start:111 stop:560 length:450 start_codon:yes stop_codon:yes gene_type:complete